MPGDDVSIAHQEVDMMHEEVLPHGCGTATIRMQGEEIRRKLVPLR